MYYVKEDKSIVQSDLELEMETCDESDVEIAYDGSLWLKGYAPAVDNEYQSKMRERAYEAETDPIQTHIDRLKDGEQTPEIIAEIEALRIERDEKIAAIKARYPYAEETEIVEA